jgi:hypothetical protein
MEFRDGPPKRPLISTSNWAILFCVAGTVSIFLPWSELNTYGSRYNGLGSWHGIPTGITFVVLFLFLVATTPLYPVPLWRSIILFVAGGLILLFSGMFIGQTINRPPCTFKEAPTSRSPWALGCSFSALWKFGECCYGARGITRPSIPRAYRRSKLERRGNHSSCPLVSHAVALVMGVALALGSYWRRQAPMHEAPDIGPPLRQMKNPLADT